MSLLAIAVIAGNSGCGSSGPQDEGVAKSVDERAASTPTFAFNEPSGGPPPGWIVGTTNATGESDHAGWSIRVDNSSPSPPASLALLDTREHTGQQYNLLWNSALSLADIDVSVAVRAVGGVEDQGGGPAWRISNSANYYTARWNPLEHNFRVYSVVDGVRQQLDSAEVQADVHAWQTIRVRQIGSSITCWFNGEELLHADDAQLKANGAVGLWTKADATTCFDDLEVRAAKP